MRDRLIAVGATVMLAVFAGCSSGSNGSGSSTSTTAKTQDLNILVSNDDGYSAEGIDVLVQALRKLPHVNIAVSAPATNKSGTGTKTTPGELTATQQQTKSGYPATAVEGFPADSVNYGLAHMVGAKPDVVLTGINQGQNLGPVAALSGTVGAAKAGAAAGIPALASSAGRPEPPRLRERGGPRRELGDRASRRVGRSPRDRRRREPERADLRQCQRAGIEAGAAEPAVLDVSPRSPRTPTARRRRPASPATSRRSTRGSPP